MTNEPTSEERLPVALIAEDDRDIRELVTAKLTAAGYQVLSYGNGPEALAATHKHRPDVALLDVMMPGMNGYVVLERLRAGPATREIPVIMLTALAQSGDVERAINMGAEGYITKPFEPAELLQAMEAALAK